MPRHIGFSLRYNFSMPLLLPRLFLAVLSSVAVADIWKLYTKLHSCIAALPTSSLHCEATMRWTLYIHVQLDGWPRCAVLGLELGYAPLTTPVASGVMRNACREKLNFGTIHRHIWLIFVNANAIFSYNDLHLYTAKAKSFIMVYCLNVSVRTLLGSISMGMSLLESNPSNGRSRLLSNTFLKPPVSASQTASSSLQLTTECPIHYNGPPVSTTNCCHFSMWDRGPYLIHGS